MKIVVNESGERLDKYLSVNTKYSRSLISKMINDGYVLVNDEEKKESYKVKENDEIFIDESYTLETKVEAENIPLDIIYEDDDIIVVNKKSGMVTHPGNGNYSHTLVNALLYHTSNLSNLSGNNRVGIVHRLDKDTSGLIIACKTNKAHEILSEDFKNHNVKKTYIALLEGVVDFNKATIDAPIKRDPSNFNKMGVFKDGKESITHMMVLKKYKSYTLVSINLETGRTHQIRVHSKYINHPVVNDPVYGKAFSSFGQFLHSSEIEFVHPITKKEMHFKCELPEEFKTFLDSLV